MTNACEVVQSANFSAATDVVVPLGIAIVGALLGAGIGAWAGAMLAFKKDKVLRDEERKERQILSAHQLLFALLQQRQDLNNLETFVGEAEPDQLLLTAMDATLINKQELAFVARTHPNELNDAVMAEHEYLQAIDALSAFNDYTRAVQHFCRENAVGFDADKQVVFEVNNETYPKFQIDREHKAVAFAQLAKSIRQGIEKNKKASEVLRDLFQQQFPEEHFWTPQEKAGEATPSVDGL